jgi:hypothetical protein
LSAIVRKQTNFGAVGLSAKCANSGHRDFSLAPCLQTTAKDTYPACMSDILDAARVSRGEPKLIVRKAPHAPVWSVWAVLEGIPSEEIFEGSSEEEASSWINTGGQAWLEERRRKRNA